jgi:hypothetical protein
MIVFRLALLSVLFLCTCAIAQQAPTNPIRPALDLTPDASGSLSQAQMQQLFCVVADKDVENNKRQRDYTYIERQVQNSVNGPRRRSRAGEKYRTRNSSPAPSVAHLDLKCL